MLFSAVRDPSKKSTPFRIQVRMPDSFRQPESEERVDGRGLADASLLWRRPSSARQIHCYVPERKFQHPAWHGPYARSNGFRSAFASAITVGSGDFPISSNRFPIM